MCEQIFTGWYSITCEGVRYGFHESSNDTVIFHLHFLPVAPSWHMEGKGTTQDSADAPVTRRKTRKAESRLSFESRSGKGDSFIPSNEATITMGMNWRRQSDSTLDVRSSVVVRACLVWESAPSTQNSDSDGRTSTTQPD